MAEREVLARPTSAWAWSDPTARVTFKAKRQLPFGQLLKLVGGHDALGEWDIAEAPGEAPGAQHPRRRCLARTR